MRRDQRLALRCGLNEDLVEDATSVTVRRPGAWPVSVPAETRAVAAGATRCAVNLERVMFGAKAGRLSSPRMAWTLSATGVDAMLGSPVGA